MILKVAVVATWRWLPGATPTKLAALRRLSHICIPDWNEIYLLNPNKEIWEATCYLEKALIAKRRQVRFSEDESSDSDGYGDDDDESEFIPPHIIAARHLPLHA
ncbi:Hypothetical predicted protein [Olea europaea subsp. europaea]|uniref:Uncharacterized protein n=1 Tax=Olea europaea subsp. europaea TaxID=158383 RepID=A0A8S0SFU3_OLEEU|nr:Hypothetical predicted protein [Olea europaea subsp. europaea]